MNSAFVPVVEIRDAINITQVQKLIEDLVNAVITVVTRKDRFWPLSEHM